MEEGHWTFVAVLLAVLTAAALSKRVRGTIITMPMIYVGLGLMLSNLGFGLIKMNLYGEFVRVIAELTLVLVLASDAARITMRNLVKDHNLPTRLLVIGLPLTILTGTVVAAFLFDNLSLAEAAIVGILLAPTDAALGQAVINDKRVPMRIRQTLNIESGLNDGIAMPILLLAMALVGAEEFGGLVQWIEAGVAQIVIGALAGAAVGFLGKIFLGWGRASGWMSRHFQKISAVALALLAYALANVLGGNGFVAAFVMGITYGNMSSKESMEDLNDHVDVEVDLLILLTFMIVFGAIMLPAAIRLLDWKIVLYAFLSLTVIRLVPVAISLVGERVKGVTVGFLGWFGPRGTASILYLIVVLEADSMAGIQTIYAVTLITVFFSVFAHGISAAPGARWYGKIMANEEFVGIDAAERRSVPVVPVRGPVIQPYTGLGDSTTGQKNL